MTDFSIFAEREKSGWSEPDIVAAYVDKFGPVTDDAGRQMISAHDLAGKKVLDLCCGQGNLTAMLADAGAEVTGLDFSAEMLGRARQAVPQATLVEADAARMPFEDGTFDAVFNNFGMMHLPDAAAALKEVARILRPGGTFAMATWEAPPRSPAFGTVFGTLKALADFSKAPAQPDLFAFTEESYARDAFELAGLELTGHGTVPCAWEVGKPEDFFDIFLTATVGARMLISSQPPETVEAIEARVTSVVAEKFAAGDGYRIPVPVCVAQARKS